jgi:hypothetical protein
MSAATNANGTRTQTTHHVRRKPLVRHHVHKRLQRLLGHRLLLRRHQALRIERIRIIRLVLRIQTSPRKVDRTMQIIPRIKARRMRRGHRAQKRAERRIELFKRRVPPARESDADIPLRGPGCDDDFRAERGRKRGGEDEGLVEGQGGGGALRGELPVVGEDGRGGRRGEGAYGVGGCDAERSS